ncbi:MAG: hypothetical protein ACRD26_05760, partial [Vicinamibacterales bacterium]
VEEMRTRPIAREAAVPMASVARWLLARLASGRDVVRFERWTYSERELEGIERLREARAGKEKRLAERVAAREADRRARIAGREAREAEKRARAEAARVARAARLVAKQRYREAKQAARPGRPRRSRSTRLKNLIKQKLGWA